MFTAAWVAWIAAFVVIEGIALYRKKEGDTLSEHVWKWFGTARDGRPQSQPSGWVRLRRFALLAFMVWLSVHFLTGGLV